MTQTFFKSGGSAARKYLGFGLAAMQLLLCAEALAQATSRGAYLMPYTRYEADVAIRSANAQLLQTTNFDISTLASEASEQKFVSLPVQNTSVEWTVSTAGNGVTMRYTMPDSADGEGLYGSVDVYVNGVFDQTVKITSHYGWQYYVHQEPENTPVPFANSDYIAMRFDETHFKLNHGLNVGDKIKIVKSNNDGLAYGIDFIELEPVPDALPKPAGYVSITDFGATPNDTVSDLAAFNSALAAAGAAGTGVYLPAGKWDFNNKVMLTTSNIGIKGAGMWYTEIYYSNPAKFSGGMLSRVTNVEISDIYFNTINNRRFAAPGDYMIYKAFMGTYGNNSKFHHVWAEHFEVGAWLGGYDAPYPVDVTSNLLISHARFRNNYADGVNFSQGTNNSIVEQTNIRNSGDDGLAMWPSNSPAVVEEVNNVFRYSTVEHVYRAGGVAIFGGRDHKVHNMLIRDCFGGSGIRFTTDFSGYTFSEQGLYRIYDVDITRCGTSYDLWHRPRGAVEIYAPNGIRNMQFDNIKITDAQRHGVQMYGNGFTNMTFNNVIINGTGRDASVRNVLMNSYGGVGIYAEANSGSVTFNNVAISNFEDVAVVNQNQGFVLNITTAPVPLQGISFPSASVNMANGDTQSVDVTFNPPQATNKNVTFTSSNPSTVAVSAGSTGSATLQALKVGSAVITATAADGGFKATTTVTVTPAVSIAVVGDSAVEGGADGSVKISAPQIAQQIAVKYTVTGTANSSRYITSPSLTGTVLLDPTHTEQVINISAINDTVFQGNQTLVITLEAGTGYQLSKSIAATVKIIDNEFPACTAPIVNYTSTTPVVDGQVDAAWATAPSTAINNVTFGSKPADFSGKWRAIATPSALYVLVEVNDSSLKNDSGASWWEDDVVELFIDGDNSKKTTYDHANDFQLGFRWGDAAVNVGGNSVANITGIVQRQLATATGYNLEVSIPWSTIGVTPLAGSKIGFDVAVDGDNDGGVRDSQMTSISTTGTGWTDPSVFGSPYITPCSGTVPSSSSSSSSSISSVSSSSSSVVIPSSSSSSSKSSSSSSAITSSSSSSKSSSSLSSAIPSSSSSKSSSLSSSSSSRSSSSSSSVAATSYRIINHWKNTYLCDGGDFVTYSAASAGTVCQWVLENVGNGRIEIRNLATGDYMNIENLTGKVQATTRNPAWDSSKWVLETVDSTYSRVKNFWQPTQYIHVENQLGAAQSGVIYPSWWSAQWQFEAVQ